MSIQFNDPGMIHKLVVMSPVQRDRAHFGIIELDHNHVVIGYNRYERNFSGLYLHEVKGKLFFDDIAPCAKNFMISERLNRAQELDVTFNYMFTYKLEPFNVRVRLLKSKKYPTRFVLVKLKEL